MTLSIDRPGKGIERGRCTRSGRAPAREAAVLHWLANERQGRLWLQCRASFFRFYTYFQLKISIFFSNSPFFALKRNAKRPFLAPNLDFSNEKSIFLMQKRHFFVLGDLGRP